MDKITLFFGKQNDEMEFHWLPLTLVFLASYLDLEKTEVVVIDERIENEKTQKLIDEHLPQSVFFGISSSTGFQLNRSIEVAQYAKRKFPEIPIVWGGAHVTALTEESLQESFVDVVVAGRGEEILPRLIKGVKDQDLEGIPGVYWKKNGQIEGVPNDNYKDFNLMPELPYKMLRIEKYINPKTKAINMTTSWGCENRCTFCYWYRNYNPWSSFSAERVFSEAKQFKEDYGIENLYFLEADYFGDVKRSLEIANLVKCLNITYQTNARATDMAFLSEKDFKDLEDSGCSTIHVGLESGSPKMLKLMNKRLNLDDMLKAARNSRNTNIHIFLALIFHLPGEKIEDVKVTYDFVQELRNINPNIRAQISSFIPLPNLPLTRLATKYGFVLPRRMKEWSRGLLVKKNSFDKKPWMEEKFAIEYEKVFNDLFPESQSMSSVYEKSDDSYDLMQ